MTVPVTVSEATVVHGVAHVLDRLTVAVVAGSRIGVVGRNGSGKSTLLRLLAGRQEPDTGRVSRPSGQSVGLLGQADDLDPSLSVRAAVVGRRPAHDWASDARVREVLTGLLGGLDAPLAGGLEAAVGRLSGGERRRVALAGLLVADLELLLLDEPTNHLDIEAVAWLAAHLAARRARSGSALVVVTHDRWFLDAVATLTWEVDAGLVHAYEGGYAAYVLGRAERERMATAAAERRANLLRKELAWLRRGPPARSSKPRFRIEAANALIADEPPARDEVALTQFATRRLGKDVIDLVDATVVLGARTLLDRVTWRLAPGERVGVVGANGSGKSTLLQAVAGEVALAGGQRRVGRTVAVAHLTQLVRELDRFTAYRVIEAVEDVRRVTRIGKREVTASQLATRLGFPRGRQRTLVGDLSGGERRRLQLLRLLMAEPNVLLLDEPTNDLDIETLTSLEDVLDGWAGTLLVVSHDRYLLERVTDRQVALFGDGQVRDLPGGVDQYLQLLGEQAPYAVPEPAARAEPDPSAPAGLTAAQVRESRKVLARVEKALSRVAEREERLHAQMVDKADDHTAVLALNDTLRALVDEREQLELQWLAAAEQLG